MSRAPNLSELRAAIGRFLHFMVTVSEGAVVAVLAVAFNK